MINRYETIKIDANTDNFERTPEGFIRIPARVTRSGIFLYRKSDGSVVRELRPKEEVFNEDSLKSILGKPITNDHPTVGSVNSQNAKLLSVGFTGDSVEEDEGTYVRVPLTITDEETIQEIINGKRQISCGYQCLVEDKSGEAEGERFDSVQTGIRYNHVAIVDKGRAGPNVRIDGEDAVLVDGEDQKESKIKKEDHMELTKVMLGEKEVQVAKEDAAIVSDFVKEIEVKDDSAKSHEDEIKSLKEDAAHSEKQMEKKDSKIKELEKKVDSLEEAAKSFDSRVIEASKERAALIKVANDNLEEEVLEKLDSMTSIEIKKAIVESRTNELKLDDASDEFINAAYQTALHVKEDKAPSIGEAIVGSRADSADKNDADDARAKMIERQKKAHESKN